VTQSGDIRREIKLGAHQTKGSKGRTVILPERVRKELNSFLATEPRRHGDAPLIASQRNQRAFTNVSLSMLFKDMYEVAGIRTSSHSGRLTFATRLNEKGVGMRTIQKLMGASPHWNDGTILRSVWRDDEECCRVGLSWAKLTTKGQFSAMIRRIPVFQQAAGDKIVAIAVASDQGVGS
jgi:integrase